MLGQIWAWIKVKFDPKPVKLAIVRRYLDANGSYVGELYIEEQGKNFKGYTMIGASLDTLPFGCHEVDARCDDHAFYLDTEHDFLAYIDKNVLRVGALNPADNNAVRRMVAKMPRRGMRIIVQNRFVENVMERA